MKRHESVAVIGAGIVGIAHAWREAVRGADVTLFERSRRAEGASIRNFGMVWPIGQPESRLECALRSRSLWEEFLRETSVWSAPGGSLHVATHGDEWRVLQEFYETKGREAYDCRLVTTAEAQQISPGVDAPTLYGGLYSSNEVGVDPRQVIGAAPQWLADRHGVTLEFNTTVSSILGSELKASDGRSWRFDRFTVASGSDFAMLYPEVFRRHALAKCKLQMMRTVAQPNGWRLGAMLAGGLTLRHYPTFADCTELPALKERIAEETPELDRYGIHVMAAQNEAGEVVLGDSHEYGDSIEPFDNEAISQLILRELAEWLHLPTWSLAARWSGIYAIQPNAELQFVHKPSDEVTIVIATGGCGMTMSFGLAEEMIASRDVGAAPPTQKPTGLAL